MLIIEGCGSEKTYWLFKLLNQKPDINKIWLYPENPYEAKYQFLINKRETTGLKHFNNSKAFIENSDDMNDIYRNIKEYIIKTIN